jgi:hypothetical protein
MNAIRCPQCSTVNSLSALDCQQCHFTFRNLPPTAFVSVPTSEVYQSQNPNSHFAIPRDNETGRKAFFWYRVYCGVMVAIYLSLAAMGIALTVIRPETNEQSAEEVLIMGIIYGVLGAVLFLVFAVALFLPRKSWNWIVGIVMMALGMTSCCFLPFLIPLLIYWLKPETKAYFGRN